MVQAHLFDDVVEPKGISLIDYLLRDDIEIISFRQCERLASCWASQRLEWHLKRGLKISFDGQQIGEGSNKAPILTKDLEWMTTTRRRDFATRVK